MPADTQLDRTLTALADPTRRAILQRLSLGETRISDLARPFDMTLTGVSKHIRVLEAAELVRRRKAGREQLLTLNPEPMDAARAWMDAQRAAWTARLDALDAALRAKDAEGDAR